MRFETLRINASMQSLEVEDADWAVLSRAEALRLITLLLSARRFEEAMLDLDKRGLVHGPAHSSIGQEGGAAGCVAALPIDTKINGTHRAHHQCIAKTINALYDVSLDLTRSNGLPDPMRREITAMLAEILGLRDGWTGGRGGSMHLRNDALGITGTNAIVAGGLPIACGIAFADKVRATGTTMVSFFGDGAVHQGATHEAMNLAALYGLPIIFFLENNKYAVSMSIEQSTRETMLMTRPVAHGIPALRVDGMNPLAVWLATRWAHKQVASSKGPAFIQADVYRYYHQSRPFPGSAFGYRTKEEEEQWRTRDPLTFMRKELPARGILSLAEIDTIDAQIVAAVKDAVEHCVEGEGVTARIRPALWPDVSTVDEGITGDLSEFAGVRFAEPEDFAPGEMEEVSLIEVMPRAVGARMERDPSIYIFGEDVANLNGGTVGATRGLISRFPDRIVNTPITENGFCGLAVGAAVSGLRPIVELMYSDFFMVAADQLLNQAGKIRHLFGGKWPVPMVLRCRIPGTEGYGSQHSMDPSGVFTLFPGWRIVAPSNAFDYVGLINSAMQCNDPVLIIEHQSLHKKKSLVPKMLDYFIPIGKARKVRDGNQITLITTLALVEECCRTADEMKVSADIIDLRTLSMRDIDYATIEASIRKTGNVAIIEQTTRGTSLGSHVADEIQRRYFDYLDQPVKRVTGGWAPPTVSKVLEQAALAGSAQIERMIRELLNDSGQFAAAAE